MIATTDTPKKTFARTAGLCDTPMHYCAGCSHGIAHRLVAEVLEELEVLDRTVGICPVGCAVFAYDYFNVDMLEAAHGRAPAVATGVKRACPDAVVFTYQGDGDLASIGIAEIIHAAARGEKITVIFINNAVYGMTGGQMAPTTLTGMKTSTSPLGREPGLAGYPIRVSEMLATLDGAAYIARHSLHSPKAIMAAKKAITRAFQVQLDGRGFSLVELLCTCPTWWGKSPKEAMDWVEEGMCPTYPVGVVLDRTT
ncbi:MAG TPA: thiamine pyrophosphate-dependent enzyme [Armatimonadota bacterium]|nr:thiamine pyrophosphate-dependent enzyme [Armatimonadota bacterium]